MSLANTLIEAMDVMFAHGVEVRSIRMTTDTARRLAGECRCDYWIPPTPPAMDMFNGARIEIDDGRKSPPLTLREDL